MKQKIVLLCYLLFLFKLLPQELELSETHEEILTAILKMNITVRIYRNAEKPVWNETQSKLTIPGKAVTLKLESKELKIYGIFTPYQVKDNLVLLAQSQVVILPASGTGLRYYNSVKTLLITLSESIFFYPLGKKESFTNTGEGDIEIEIQLVPYALPGSEKANPDNKTKTREEQAVP